MFGLVVRVSVEYCTGHDREHLGAQAHVARGEAYGDAAAIGGEVLDTDEVACGVDPANAVAGHRGEREDVEVGKLGVVEEEELQAVAQ